MRTLRALRRPAATSAARCDLCGDELASRHHHLIAHERRELRCACFACAAAAARGWRAVPPRLERTPMTAATTMALEALAVPVSLVYFVVAGAGPVAYYPGPAGVAATPIDEPAWRDLCLACEGLSSLGHDVDAWLVSRSDGAWQGYLVSIDRCYELCGALRGRPVRAHADARARFFAALEEDLDG
jgi:hypothetical protein